MKQVSHENVLPFYGVSTAISDFCLVSPWYNNGEIMEYLKKKPDTNRYDLASVLKLVNDTLDAYLNLTNSYWEQSMDCASYTTFAWYTVHYDQCVKPYPLQKPFKSVSRATF